MNLQRTFGALLEMLADSVEGQGAFDPRARIVRQFREAGVWSPKTARRFYPRSSAEAAAFARLLQDFVICQSTPGHYFLNVDALRRRWPLSSFLE